MTSHSLGAILVAKGRRDGSNPISLRLCDEFRTTSDFSPSHHTDRGEASAQGSNCPAVALPCQIWLRVLVFIDPLARVALFTNVSDHVQRHIPPGTRSHFGSSIRIHGAAPLQSVRSETWTVGVRTCAALTALQCAVCFKHPIETGAPTKRRLHALSAALAPASRIWHFWLSVLRIRIQQGTKVGSSSVAAVMERLERELLAARPPVDPKPCVCGSSSSVCPLPSKSGHVTASDATSSVEQCYAVLRRCGYFTRAAHDVGGGPRQEQQGHACIRPLEQFALGMIRRRRAAAGLRSTHRVEHDGSEGSIRCCSRGRSCYSASGSSTGSATMAGAKRPRSEEVVLLHTFLVDQSTRSNAPVAPLLDASSQRTRAPLQGFIVCLCHVCALPCHPDSALRVERSGGGVAVWLGIESLQTALQRAAATVGGAVAAASLREALPCLADRLHSKEVIDVDAPDVHATAAKDTHTPLLPEDALVLVFSPKPCGKLELPTGSSFPPTNCGSHHTDTIAAAALLKKQPIPTLAHWLAHGVVVTPSKGGPRRRPNATADTHPDCPSWVAIHVKTPAGPATSVHGCASLLCDACLLF